MPFELDCNPICCWCLHSSSRMCTLWYQFNLGHAWNRLMTGGKLQIRLLTDGQPMRKMNLKGVLYNESVAAPKSSFVIAGRGRGPGSLCLTVSVSLSFALSRTILECTSCHFENCWIFWFNLTVIVSFQCVADDECDHFVTIASLSSCTRQKIIVKLWK